MTKKGRSIAFEQPQADRAAVKYAVARAKWYRELSRQITKVDPPITRNGGGVECGVINNKRGVRHKFPEKRE